ncbi:unnamed protein product, partial [Vitis vinifera]
MKKEYKIILPEDFQFPSQELRYLHWKGYPLKSLPSKFSWREPCCTQHD